MPIINVHGNTKYSAFNIALSKLLEVTKSNKPGRPANKKTIQIDLKINLHNLINKKVLKNNLNT